MRTATFATVSGIVFLFIGHFFHSWLTSYDLSWWAYLSVWLVFGTAVGMIVAEILERLNVKLLAYRKANGRDILDEERYESDGIDHGMITLHPKNESNELER
ncbi:MAG: hypothetical protein K1X52_02740 [Pyrinomonadaceae bacterium]|nr:hypothetical protein [Pyrinomonadaceae bacterium]